MQERTLAPRSGRRRADPARRPRRGVQGHLAGQPSSPDFNSFLKKGDERIRMLEQVDRLPDLQRDFTQSQYKMVFQRSKELRGGLRPDQVSPQKLRELLNEMERSAARAAPARRGAAISREGMEALEGGQSEQGDGRHGARAVQDAHDGGEGARGQGASGRARERAARRPARASAGRGSRAGRATRATSPRARACSRAAARARRPRAIPPSACAAIPSTSASRASRGSGRKEGFDTNLLGQRARTSVAAAVPRGRGPVPQDDGGGDRARAGAARLPGPGQAVLPVPGRAVSRMPATTAGQDLLSADFLAQLERLALLSRRSFRGRVQAASAAARARASASSSPTTGPTATATTSGTSTGTSTGGSTACTSSCSSTRRTSA